MEYLVLHKAWVYGAITMSKLIFGTQSDGLVDELFAFFYSCIKVISF